MGRITTSILLPFLLFGSNSILRLLLNLTPQHINSDSSNLFGIGVSALTTTSTSTLSLTSTPRNTILSIRKENHPFSIVSSFSRSGGNVCTPSRLFVKGQQNHEQQQNQEQQEEETKNIPDIKELRDAIRKWSRMRSPQAPNEAA